MKYMKFSKSTTDKIIEEFAELKQKQQRIERKCEVLKQSLEMSLQENSALKECSIKDLDRLCKLQRQNATLRVCAYELVADHSKNCECKWCFMIGDSSSPIDDDTKSVPTKEEELMDHEKELDKQDLNKQTSILLPDDTTFDYIAAEGDDNLGGVNYGYRVTGNNIGNGLLDSWYFPTLRLADSFANRLCVRSGKTVSVSKHIGNYHPPVGAEHGAEFIQSDDWPMGSKI